MLTSPAPRPRVTGERAWLVLAGQIAGYEARVEQEQLLSQAFARFRVAHPIAAGLCVGLTVAHLYGILPVWADPFRACGLLTRKQMRALTDVVL